MLGSLQKKFTQSDCSISRDKNCFAPFKKERTKNIYFKLNKQQTLNADLLYIPVDFQGSMNLSPLPKIDYLSE